MNADELHSMTAPDQQLWMEAERSLMKVQPHLHLTRNGTVLQGHADCKECDWYIYIFWLPLWCQ